MTVIKTYKDTVFRMVFKEKKALLSLYYAINGTDYSNPDDLEITTLENAVYLNEKNDISCSGQGSGRVHKRTDSCRISKKPTGRGEGNEYL